MNLFTCFPLLPIEIRLQIWFLTIPDDQEEVCLCWPGNLPMCQSGREPHSTIPTLPLTVDTGFPRAMHVCRESRGVVQNSSSVGSGGSGGVVRFRESRVAGCMTPFRRFRPELDVLYLSYDSIGHLYLLTHGSMGRLDVLQPGTEARWCYEQFIDVLRRTRRLAVHIGLVSLYTPTIHAFARQTVSPLESLSLVIPHSSPLQGAEAKCQDDFLPPGKRCRLVPVPETVDPETLDVTVSSYGVKVKKLASAVRDAQDLMRACRSSCTAQRCPEHNFEEKAMFGRITISAKVFVEYQKGGSWSEVCANRTFSGVGVAYSSEYIPMNRRPNPELVRVHDTDVEFAPVLVDESDEY